MNKAQLLELVQKNLGGETVLHVAAFNGHLDQIPSALLTAAALRETTSAGDTVFHAAAISGQLAFECPQVIRQRRFFASR